MKVLKYNQAKFNLMAEISLMNLIPGDYLPAEKEMADILKVSIGTLRRALAELEESGIIEKQNGRGNLLLKTPEVSLDLPKVLCLDVFDAEHGGNPRASSFQRQVDFHQCMIKHGFSPVYMNVSGFDQKLVKVASGCIGIMVIGNLREEFIRELCLLSNSVLAIGSNPYPDKIPTVSYDWRGGVEQLVSRMIASGKKRIGLLNGARNYYPASKIYQGFSDAMQKHKMNIDESIVHWGSQNFDLESFFDGKSAKCDALVLEYGAFLATLNYAWKMRSLPKFTVGIADFYNNDIEKLPVGKDFMVVNFRKSVFIEGVEIFSRLCRGERDVKGEIFISSEVLYQKKERENAI